MRTAATQREAVGFTHEVLNLEWRETLIEAAGGDSMVAALESARLLAADTATTPDVIYIAIQSFYRLEVEQTSIVMTRLAEEMGQEAAARTAA